jgi:N6-adenosine-specific RNA methylase IME4
MSHIFSPLELHSYGQLMVDTPWSFANYSAKGERKNAKSHYTCMTLDEIKRLPVSQLAGPDCLLMMWATNPLLNVAFDVLAGWGFQFKTAGHWVKRTRHGCLGFGTGYILRGAGEPFLIGTIGKPKTTRSCRSIIEGAIREHSRKPEEAYRWAEQLMPGARRAELFSRQARTGWDSWGNEVDRFAGAEAQP